MAPLIKELIRMLVIFLLGATLGTVAESQFNAWGLAYYPECRMGLAGAGPGLSAFLCLGGWCPWWAPVLFGLGGVAMATGAKINDALLWKRLGWHRPSTPTMKQAAAAAALVLLGWLAVSRPELMDTRTPDMRIRASVLTLCFCVVWVYCAGRSRASFLEAMQSAVLGTVVEIIMGRGGLYTYQPGFDELFGVPLWLPVLYALAGASVGVLARARRCPAARRSSS